jgi:hypothetical protein
MNRMMDIILKTRTEDERVELRAGTVDGQAFVVKYWGGSPGIYFPLDYVEELLERLEEAGLTLSFEASP